MRGDTLNRAYVTCHMSMSLDGKIDGNFHDAPCSEKAGRYYYDIIFDLGTSMAGGRTTTQMYSPQPNIDCSRYSNAEVTYEDNIIINPNHNYCFIYDRKGKCSWDSPTTSMNGVTMQIVEVLTKQVHKEYLAHLKSIGAAYIFAGDTELSVETSLIKMKELFGVERLVLTGGAEINGGFLNEGMIDEFSIVLQPYAEGNSGLKSLVDTHGIFNETAFRFEEAKLLDDGAVHLIFRK